MILTNLTHKDYTTHGDFHQLKLPLDVDYIIPKDDSVRLLSQVVEEMDLTELYQTYSRIRKNQATPRQMLKVMLYGCMNSRYSTRKIETSCNRDINFMYLLEGAPAPDYSTIARFRSLHFAPVCEKIMGQMTDFLAENGELSLKNLFIDGTKLEAVANKYTFVWKKSVMKNQEKLMDKIPAFILQAEKDFGIKIIYKNEIKHEYDLERNKKQSFDNRAGIIITVFSAIGFVLYDKIPLKSLLSMMSQPLTFVILINIIIIISIYLSLIVSFYYAIRIISVRCTENFDINIINQDFISCAKIDSVSKMLEIYFKLVQSHRSRNEDISKKLVKSQFAMVISIILIFVYFAFK